MKRLCYMFAAVAAVAFASNASAQLIQNGDFELPTSTTSSTGNWFRFGSGSNGVASDSTVEPHSGLGHLALELIGTSQFAGAFQAVSIPVGPGAQATFSGWHKAAAAGAESEIKLEWQGAAQNVLFTQALTSDYTQFTHTGVAPAGTTGLVVTYAIASFAAGTGSGEVYVDDITVSIVPEPATAGLLGLGLVALSCVRRRK